LELKIGEMKLGENEHKDEIEGMKPSNQESISGPQDDVVEAELRTEETGEETVAKAAIPTEIETIQDDYQKKVKELEDRYLRLAADFDNYKKRAIREFSELTKSANRELILQLLPIIDHFGLALESENNGTDIDPLRKGLELIDKDLKEFLSKLGVTEIDSIAKEFDPNIHEAVVQMPSDKYDEGIIMGQTQKGYFLGDKVLRPAKVIISSGPPSAEGSSQ